MNRGKKEKDNKIEKEYFLKKDEIEVPDIISSLNRNKSLTYTITISILLSSIYI